MENIIACNNAFHEIDVQAPEIIITGLQAGVVPSKHGALNEYPIKQQEFLMSCAPDAYILCVNPDDDLEYVKQAVHYLEGLFKSKVIIICINNVTKALTKKKEHKLKMKLMLSFKLPVCSIGDEQMPDIVATACIKHFSKNTSK